MKAAANFVRSVYLIIMIDTAFLSVTNKMQPYTIFFITVNALHVSGCFSAHHQELKNCNTTSSTYTRRCVYSF